MNELAIELNEVLKTSLCYSLLSEEGKRLYFPKGIVAQAAEAGEKAKKYNATAGLATKAGQPFHFVWMLLHEMMSQSRFRMLIKF